MNSKNSKIVCCNLLPFFLKKKVKWKKIITIATVILCVSLNHLFMCTQREPKNLGDQLLYLINVLYHVTF